MPWRLTPSAFIRSVLALAVVLLVIKSGVLDRRGGHITVQTGEDDCTDEACLKSPKHLLTTIQEDGGDIIVLKDDLSHRQLGQHRGRPTTPAAALQDRIAAIKDRMQHRLQTKTAWTKEEEALRSWVWRQGVVQPHESLRAIVGQLSSEDSALYAWSTLSLINSMKGRGVGLGLRTDSDEFESSTKPGAAPTWSQKGAKAKYDALLADVQAGDEACPTFAKSFRAYAHLHKQTLQGIRAPLFLENWLPHNEAAGSLPDRLLGLATAAMYALATKRTFLVNWERPMPFDLLFDSAQGVDWSFPFVSEAEKAHPIFGDSALTSQRKEVGATMLKKSELDAVLEEIEWGDEELSKWLRILIDRDALARSFAFSDLDSAFKSAGLMPTHAFSCLANSLLAPKPAAASMIAGYGAMFSLPAYVSIGIHIRTRDPDTPVPKDDPPIDPDAVRHFFTCADQLSSRFAESTQRPLYYVMSDSDSVLASALEAFPDRVVVSGLGALAMDSAMELTKPADQGGPRRIMDAAMDEVVEAWTFSRTDYRVITEGSSFGKMASMLNGLDMRTVALPTQPGEVPIDCKTDKAFISIESMSRDW